MLATYGWCLFVVIVIQHQIYYLHFQASVFVQSHVRAHVELMWLLSSATPLGWLNRMIQFKEKSRKAVRCCCMAALHFSFT